MSLRRKRGTRAADLGGHGVPEVVHQIPLEENAQHPRPYDILRHRASRLEEQQDPLRDVAVGVGVSSNPVYEFVADRQTSEETPGPGILVAMLAQQRPCTTGCSRVPIVRQTIDEKSPIDVAVWREFFASQRTENDEGGALRYGPFP